MAIVNLPISKAYYFPNGSNIQDVTSKFTTENPYFELKSTNDILILEFNLSSQLTEDYAFQTLNYYIDYTSASAIIGSIYKLNTKQSTNLNDATVLYKDTTASKVHKTITRTTKLIDSNGILITGGLGSISFLELTSSNETSTFDADAVISDTNIGNNPTITATFSAGSNHKYIINIIQNNAVVKSETGIVTSTSGVTSVTVSNIPFAISDNVTVEVIKYRYTGENSGNYEYYLPEKSTTLLTELTVPTADVKNFNITGASIDSDIVCTATMENVYNWTIQAIQNGVVKATKSGNGDISAIFPVGTFNIGGSTVFKLTYSNTWNGGEVSGTVDLSYTQAVISLLELPSTTINIDETFTISWVSTNQTSFKLEVDSKIYTGTTQKSVTIPKGTIGKGTKTVKLVVTFASAYYSNSAIATQSFVGYGKPANPVLTTKSAYSSATPSLTWVSDEQTAYQVVIKKGLTVIEDSGQVVSANKYYIPSIALENNITYSASVKVKNRYSLWSDDSVAEFNIQFSVPKIPTIQAISDITTGSIVLTVSTDTTGDAEYKNSEIWKREKNGAWKRMAYRLNASDVWQDFYVGGNVNYEYKARNVGQNGGISESEVIAASTAVNGYNFYDVEDNSNFLRFTCGDAPKPKINQSIVSNLFAGAEAPTNFSNGVLYWTCSLSFKTDNREDILKLVSLMRARLLLYKDNKGHKWFGNITNSPDFPEDDVEDITINIEFTQSQFAEEDVYCGDNLTLIKWNGGWKFDGTHTFGGE